MFGPDKEFDDRLGRVGKVAELGPRLTKLVRKAWLKLDADGSGEANKEDILLRYSGAEAEGLLLFIKSIEFFLGGASDGSLSWEEFRSYGLYQRNMCPHDLYFKELFAQVLSVCPQLFALN